MPTVAVQVSAFTGDTGLSLWLYNALTGTLLNSGGDALTETGATGYFTANVAESLGNNDYTAVVRKSGAAVFDGVLHSSRTTVGLGPVSSASFPNEAPADWLGEAGLSTAAKQKIQLEILDAIDLINGSKGSGIYSDTVTDNAGQPVEGADVWITPVGQTSPRVDAATTNSLGQFTLRADPGQYTLRVQRSGLQSTSTTITIT